jgi:hypothetical protein
MQLYDLNKKGTILFGIQRSGTHYVLNFMKLQLIRQNIKYTDNSEYFKDLYSIDVENPISHYSFLNVIDKIKEQDTSTTYSVGTMVYHDALDYISQYQANYDYFFNNYHVIKMVRKRLMDQFMSQIIFKVPAWNSKHNGITSIKELNFKEDLTIPYTASKVEIVNFMNQLLKLERFKAETIFYEDFPHYPLPDYIKNIYGITPKEFFANYDEIFYSFKQLNITHYEW